MAGTRPQSVTARGLAERAAVPHDRDMDELTVTDNAVGSALARSAVDQVRASGRHVVPLCPFIRAYVARHPEYQDLVRPAPDLAG